MSFEIIPAAEIPLAEQAAVANAAFANYVGGWTDINAESLTRFLMLQGADLYLSRFVRHGGELAGFGYITRTCDVVRLSGMALLPSARGTGAAAHLLQHLLGEGKQRGDRLMMLEVIQQNPRAVACYRRHGFEEFGELLAWRHKGAGEMENTPDAAAPIDIASALRFRSVKEYPEIPWQISRHALAKLERAQAFAAENACVVISDASADPLRIYGIFSETNDWPLLRRLLRAVRARHPGREFFAPAIWPEEFGRELFEPLGFERDELSQFYMRYEL